MVNTIPRSVYKQLALRRLEALIGVSMGSGSAAAPAKPDKQTAQSQSNTLTPMSRTVLLCLQYPHLLRSVSREQLAFDANAPGADVLTRLITYCEADPDVTTARLLERFRDTKHFAYLTRLASRSYLPDGIELDEEQAATEFTHCLQRLADSAKATAADKLDQSARTGLLALKRR